MRSYKRKRPVLEIIEDIEEKCRLCLEKSNNTVPIFRSETSDMYSSLSARIMLCVGIEVTRDTNLPNIVCSECVKQMDICYSFKKMCENAHQKLKMHLQAIQIKESNKNLHELQKSLITNEIIKVEKNLCSKPEPEKEQASRSIILIHNEVDSEIIVESVSNNEVVPNITPNHIQIHHNEKQSCTENVEKVTCKPKKVVRKNITKQPVVINSIEAKKAKLDPHTPGTLLKLDLPSLMLSKLFDAQLVNTDGKSLVVNEEMNAVFELVTQDETLVTLQIEEEDDQEVNKCEGSVTYLKEIVGPALALPYPSDGVNDE